MGEIKLKNIPHRCLASEAEEANKAIWARLTRTANAVESHQNQPSCARDRCVKESVRKSTLGLGLVLTPTQQQTNNPTEETLPAFLQ